MYLVGGYMPWEVIGWRTSSHIRCHVRHAMRHGRGYSWAAALLWWRRAIVRTTVVRVVLGHSTTSLIALLVSKIRRISSDRVVVSTAVGSTAPRATRKAAATHASSLRSGVVANVANIGVASNVWSMLEP